MIKLWSKTYWKGNGPKGGGYFLDRKNYRRILLIPDFSISYKGLIELRFLSTLPFITNLSSYSTKLPDVRYSSIKKGGEMLAFRY